MTCRRCAAVPGVGGSAVEPHVLNELAAADDGRMTLLQRVSLTTDRGTLSLLSPMARCCDACGGGTGRG